MNDALVLLGGMGPQASLKLHELLLALSRPYHDGSPDKYPAILHASLSIPDFIATKEHYQEAVYRLQRACQELPLASARAIGMACNTAHLMLNELPLADTPFISMIDAVVGEIQQRDAHKVGLLASPNTLRSGLYDKALHQVGIAVAKPTRAEATQLNKVIHGVINDEEPTVFRESLDTIADRMVRTGADTLLLGCTELPLIGLDERFSSVSSLEALAKAMLTKYYNA